MGGLIEAAGALLERMNMRSEVAAQNIANITTPGYKSRVAFSNLLGDDDETGVGSQQTRVPGNRDWSDGKIVSTHNPLDLALSGNGFFVLRSGDALYYTRAGQFSRDADGHLVSGDGMLLQAATGDIVLTAGAPAIDADGTIHDGGKAEQQIAVVDIQDKTALSDVGGGLFTTAAGMMHDVASAQIQQGALEASNVSNGTEMTSIMASLRGAETGQRIAQLYDDLLSQAAGSFGQGAG